MCAADVEEVVAGFAASLGADGVDQAAFRHMANARFDKFWLKCVEHADTIRAAATEQESAAIVQRINQPLWDDLEAAFDAYRCGGDPRSIPGDVN